MLHQQCYCDVLPAFLYRVTLTASSVMCTWVPPMCQCHWQSDGPQPEATAQAGLATLLAVNLNLLCSAFLKALPDNIHGECMYPHCHVHDHEVNFKSEHDNVSLSSEFSMQFRVIAVHCSETR